MMTVAKLASCALSAAIALGAASCATTARLASSPQDWATWTDKPTSATDAPRLAEMVAESPGLRASSAAWLAKWTRSPMSLAWTDATLELVVKYQQNPLRAARALTLVHVAMHDALVLAAREGVPERARGIAIHRAAGLVLAHLYPNETPGRMEGLGISGAVAVARRNRVSGEEFARAYNAGSGAGEAAIRRALGDGSGRVWPVRLRPPHAAGRWAAAPPLNIYDPAEAFAGEWRTWVLKDGGEIQPPPPLTFDSPEYWREVEEVLRISRALTPEQKKIAADWNLDNGSVTPSGVWNRKARELALAHGLNDAQTIRLFAALNVAMMDSFIACWRAKFTWWTLRPVNAIRDRFEREYLPHINTPAFPSYVSGHSSVSGAAAEVLSGFFPAEAPKLRAGAQEAAISRLYGGIHFTSDNEEGLRLGQAVGARVVETVQRSGGAITR